MIEEPAPRPWAPDKAKHGKGKDSPSLMHLGPGLYTRRVLHDPPVRADTVSNQPFNMTHFRLFHYFENDIAAYIRHLHPGFEDLAKLFINNALHNQYLMEELLAYSAAHLSTYAKASERDMYIEESMKLQTRALALYNQAAPQMSEKTCLPMFLYSSLLSHHIIYDVGLNMHNDLGVAIGWLTHSIGIHRGLILLAKAAWPIMSDEVKEICTRSCHRDSNPVPSSSNPGTECQDLLARLRSTELDKEEMEDLCTTVDLLQDRFGAAYTNNSHTTWAVIQDWLDAIPPGYVDLLNKRKPEALVVLAYFSVLLQGASAHWFVNDLGPRLARLVSENLGPEWADWLRWPNIATGNIASVPIAPEPANSYGLLF